jgi:hypothetical protein
VNEVIFNWQRPLWECDREVVKRSGRDESIRVAIHMYMETTLGISLYSYLYLKLAKTLCLSYYFLWFLFNKIREQEGRNRSARKWKGQGKEVVQTMYTHVSKCKTNKIKNIHSTSFSEQQTFTPCKQHPEFSFVFPCSNNLHPE